MSVGRQEPAGGRAAAEHAAVARRGGFVAAGMDCHGERRSGARPRPARSLKRLSLPLGAPPEGAAARARPGAGRRGAGRSPPTLLSPRCECEAGRQPRRGDGARHAAGATGWTAAGATAWPATGGALCKAGSGDGRSQSYGRAAAAAAALAPRLVERWGRGRYPMIMLRTENPRGRKHEATGRFWGGQGRRGTGDATLSARPPHHTVFSVGVSCSGLSGRAAGAAGRAGNPEGGTGTDGRRADQPIRGIRSVHLLSFV